MLADRVAHPLDSAPAVPHPQADRQKIIDPRDRGFTVQEKAIAHPTDSKLLKTAWSLEFEVAKAHGTWASSLKW